MNKMRVLLLLPGLISIGLYSCMDKDYDEVNNDIYFSQDGISIPFGSIDTVYFVDIHTENTPVEEDKTLSSPIEDLFSKDTSKMFFSEKNSSDFKLKFYIDLDIKDPSTIRLELTPVVIILDPQTGEKKDSDIDLLNGENSIVIENGKDNEVALCIKEDDMDTMQNAVDLRIDLKFSIRVEKFDEKDMFYIKNIVISKSGGIYIDL